MKNYIPLVVPLYNLSEQTPRSVPSFSYTRNIYLLKKTGKLKQFARFTNRHLILYPKRSQVAETNVYLEREVTHFTGKKIVYKIHGCLKAGKKMNQQSEEECTTVFRPWWRKMSPLLFFPFPPHRDVEQVEQQQQQFSLRE